MEKLKNWLQENPKIVLLLGLALLVLGNQYQQAQEDMITLSAEKEVRELEVVEEIAVEKELIYVHITGAVQQPGVYAVEKGQRIEDILLLAGATEEADIEALNRAALVADGQKIVVPKVRENSEFAEVIIDDGKVSINQGSLQELISLPGIGEQKGQAIIDYRQKNGGFSVLEDLCKVPGIGQATYERLMEKIKL